MGYEALLNNRDGGANTVIGYQALSRNPSGVANTAIGYASGANLNSGSYNVYIGANVGGVSGEVGHTYISNIASTQQNLSVVTVDLATGLLGHEFSSRRYKEDIKAMDSASEAIFSLQPVTYRHKKEIDKTQALDYGLVAEQVAKVDPNLAVRDGKGQIESIRYNAVNAMLLNEFLKEHKKVEAQQCKICSQEETITRLKSDSVRQEATIAELKKELESVVARSKDQDEQIQKVKARVELDGAGSRVVANKP
jgi:trimeric autotransporter adhesin